jgi:deazaflavin-dependent oxidoreductase (nitroreductase family)
MNSWPVSSERLRRMYASGRANDSARRLARMWAVVFSLGLSPRRWVTLEVTGRRTGRARRFPLGMARLNRQWYLVSMLGEHCNWVQNVRAADGLVTLRHGRAVRCMLREVPVGQRPPVLKRYLQQVPGARPHFPVGRKADMSGFEALAPRYPVFLVARMPRAGAVKRSRPSGATRPRRWWRWLLAGAVAIIVIIAGAVAAFIELSPSFAPLALPSGRVAAPAGPLSATWQVARGSIAGFRVEERALGVSNYVGGQTPAVTGVIVISGNKVTGARFDINLAAVKVNGKTQPQFVTSLGVHRDPVARFALAKPVRLSPAFARGGTVRATATGALTMNGVSRPATVMLTARRDGPELQAAGYIPVEFARWSIRQPAGFGFVGSLAGNGEAEFLLILRRQ